jgi:hypothetical protein
MGIKRVAGLAGNWRLMRVKNKLERAGLVWTSLDLNLAVKFIEGTLGKSQTFSFLHKLCNYSHVTSSSKLDPT